MKNPPKKYAKGKIFTDGFAHEEPLILILTVDTLDANKTPGVYTIYAKSTLVAITKMRSSGIMSQKERVILAKSISEAEANEFGITSVLPPFNVEDMIRIVRRSKSKSFVETFDQTELYNSDDLVSILLELDVLMNPETYPEIMQGAPDEETIIDSFAASRGLLKRLNNLRAIMKKDKKKKKQRKKIQGASNFPKTTDA